MLWKRFLVFKAYKNLSQRNLGFPKSKGSETVSQIGGCESPLLELRSLSAPNLELFCLKRWNWSFIGHAYISFLRTFRSISYHNSSLQWKTLWLLKLPVMMKCYQFSATPDFIIPPLTSKTSGQQSSCHHCLWATEDRHHRAFHEWTF